jgi:hypothetical protein
MVKRFLQFSGLVFALLLCGCGSSDSSDIATGSSQSSGVESSGQIEGFLGQLGPAAREGVLAQGSSVVLSGTALASGATPVSSGMVVATNAQGVVVGMSLTNASGRFLLTGLPGGMVTLTATTNPASTTPDVTLSMTAVPGSRLAPNSGPPISRDSAIERTRPLFVPSDLVSCSLNPIPAGAVVEVAGHPEASRKLDESSWLLFINQIPLVFFEHPAVVVYVSAQTGDLESFPVQSYPTVNSAPLWGNPLELIAYPPGGQATPLPEAVQVPSALLGVVPPSLRSEVRAQNNTKPDSVFALLISPSDDKVGRASTRLLQKGVLKDIPKGNVVLMDFIPGTDTTASFKKRIAEELEFMKDQIDARAAKQLDSTLIFYIASHCNGKIRVGGDYSYTAQEILDAGLLKSRACRVRVILEACFTELIIQDLNTLIKAGASGHDVKLYAAAGATKYCRYPGDKDTQKGLFAGTFTDTVNQEGRIENGDLLGLEEGTDSNGDPKLSGPFEDIMTATPTGGSTTQDPKLLIIPGKPGFCPGSPTPDPAPEPVEEKKSEVVFKNETEDRVTLRLESENKVINGGNPVVLEPFPLPGSEFKEEFIGPLEKVKVSEFDEPSAKIPVLETNLEIEAGQSLELRWAEDEGTRVLSNEVQQKGLLITESP